MSNDVITSVLSQPLIKSLREVILYAMEAFAPILKEELKRRDDEDVTSFFNFHDLEISVSTDPLISDKCAALQNNEMVVFTRFKEKFITDNTMRQPRNLLIPICLSTTPNFFPFLVARVWELYAPRWEHEDMITTDPRTIIYLKAGVLKQVQKGIVEASEAAMKKREMTE